ncbi:integrase [Bradyrhizobium sp. S3.9.1]|uniref:tyrosine-type recombinase/integrase n=1 Tax=Bradyrhizobium sp. S3.9.1 TaxID=3156431 RepID=UPI00339413CE
MVVKVRLEGLNIVRARGRWYVYFRDGGLLLKGFEGTRDELMIRLAEPDLMGAYNGRRKRDLSRVYPEGTLGSVVAWFKSDCPRYAKLSDATRKDYDAAYEWLRPEFDCPLEAITTPSLYEVRDRCAKEKWPRFADKMISALSSMFTQAVKRNKMLTNPCLGMDKGHTANPNANREWYADEWQAVIDLAPMEIRTALMLARFAGLRGQTIVVANWKQYQPHPLTGMCIRLVTKKNDEKNFLPVMPELQAFLATIKVRTKDGHIALRDDGTPWVGEKDMQTRVSHWLRDREREGLIGAGTTLHGLRVSYAAWWKRTGATNSEVADLLGDKSEAMGKHYTRHVEREVNVVRAFNRAKDGA